jgi:small subunit ribosomal protein S6
LRPYEMMVILDPEIDERSVGSSLDQYLSVVKDGKGTIDKVDIWGRRRLAYPIKKRTDGIYAVINFTASADAAKELDRQLNLNETVLRTKLLRVEVD